MAARPVGNAARPADKAPTWIAGMNTRYIADATDQRLDAQDRCVDILDDIVGRAFGRALGQVHRLHGRVADRLPGQIPERHHVLNALIGLVGRIGGACDDIAPGWIVVRAAWPDEAKRIRRASEARVTLDPSTSTDQLGMVKDVI